MSLTLSPRIFCILAHNYLNSCIKFTIISFFFPPHNRSVPFMQFSWVKRAIEAKHSCNLNEKVWHVQNDFYLHNWHHVRVKNNALINVTTHLCNLQFAFCATVWKYNLANKHLAKKKYGNDPKNNVQVH